MNGIIIRKCFVNVLSEEICSRNRVELMPGTLMKILPSQRIDGCQFRILVFTNFIEENNPKLYHCSNDDYIVVDKHLWPYLIAIQKKRTTFLEKVINKQFDMDLFKLDTVIRIRGPSVKIKYLDFVVMYVGVVKTIGVGYYIALRSKNGNLTPNLKYHTKHYQFGGTGIVVSALWIMQNQYKEEKCKHPLAPQNKISISEFESLGSGLKCVASDPNVRVCRNENCGNILISSQKHDFNNLKCKMCNNIDEPDEEHENKLDKIRTNEKFASKSTKRIIETGAIPKLSRGSSKNPSEVTKMEPNNCIAEIENINNSDGSVKNLEKTNCELCAKPVDVGHGVILRECLHTFCPHCIREHVKRNSMQSSIKCPYNKDYKCQFDLIDTELKDLGGKLLYDKILDNRLNEYVSNDSSAQVCSNRKCKHIWVSEDEIIANNNRCPQCNRQATNKYRKSQGPQDKLSLARKKVKENDVNKSAGAEMLKVFLASEDNQKETSKAIMCCCTSQASDCFIILKCEHYICRKFLTGILKEQLQSISRTACPICFKEIDDNEKILLVSQLQSEAVKKCGICSNQAGVKLSVCQDTFCHKCVRNMITNQILYTNKVSLNCITCDEPITNSDILQYGGQDVFDYLQLKIELAKLAATGIDNIMLNNSSFRCGLCVQFISVNRGILFIGCCHCFCFGCCKKFTDRQLKNSQKPACPDCEKQLKFEMDSTIKKTDKINGSIDLIECLKCEDKFEVHFMVECSKCANSICMECSRTTIINQIENSRHPNCPFCQLLLDDSQIARITSGQRIIHPEKLINNDSSSIHPEKNLFECIMCEQLTSPNSIVELVKCKHAVCCKCLEKKIPEQLKWSPIPKCPLCLENIDEIQCTKLFNY